MGVLHGLAHLTRIYPSFDPWRRGSRVSAEKGMDLQTSSEEGAEHSPSQNKSPDCGQGKLQLDLGTETAEL